MEYEPFADYYLVNGQRLRELTDTTTTWLESDYPRTVVEITSGEEQSILEGEWSASDMVAAYGEAGGEISEGEAAELAAIENKAQHSLASIEVTSALAQLSMLDALESSMKGHRHDQEENDRPFLGFERARWVRSVFHTGVTLSCVTFEGLEGGKSGSVFTISSDDGHLEETLRLCRVGDTVETANFSVRPVGDELIERCVRLLGEQKGRAIVLMGGHFEDKRDLDETLHQIWSNFQTTSQEEEVGHLLNGEVRQRALAAKESIQFSVDHNLGLPTADKLAEFAQILI